MEGGDQTKFGLRKGNLTQSDNTTILKASSEESRRQWLIKIRELILEMPIKVQAESSENGSMLSYYNGSLESVKKLSIQEGNRVSTSSSESNAIKQTSSNGTDPSAQVEMRRPRNLLQNQSFAPLQNGITLSNDNFLLPLDENHYENLVSRQLQSKRNCNIILDARTQHRNSNLVNCQPQAIYCFINGLKRY